MKLIKKALLGLTLAVAASVAGATTITDSFFLFGDMNNPGTLQTYSINVAASDYNAQAGDMFIFDFGIPLPPGSMFDSLTFAAVPGIDGTLTFSSAALYPGNAPAYGLDPVQFPITFSPSLVFGDGIVESGVYDLELSGTFLDASASLTVLAASDLATVPEPMSLSLIGLGLAGMAGLRRRKAA